MRIIKAVNMGNSRARPPSDLGQEHQPEIQEFVHCPPLLARLAVRSPQVEQTKRHIITGSGADTSSRDPTAPYS